MTRSGSIVNRLAGLPPTVQRLLPRYRELATGLGYVALRDLVAPLEYVEARQAIEREYVHVSCEGWYFTTTRDGSDIQIQIDEANGKDHAQ